MLCARLGWGAFARWELTVERQGPLEGPGPSTIAIFLYLLFQLRIAAAPDYRRQSGFKRCKGVMVLRG